MTPERLKETEHVVIIRSRTGRDNVEVHTAECQDCDWRGETWNVVRYALDEADRHEAETQEL